MTDKPFIFLFRTPRCFYFYDVNKGITQSISEEAYHNLEKILGKPGETGLSEELKSLLDQGFLSSNRPEKIAKRSSSNIERALRHELSSLLLQVTQACNLTCIYCPYAANKTEKLSRVHHNKYMTFETAQRAMNFLYAHSDAAQHITIGFYGGEPLLAFPVVKQSVEYANKLFEGKPITYTMTTNATLLTTEMISFMSANHFNLTFSLDGPKAIHDRHRLRADGSPTYDQVVNALRRAVEIYEKEQKGILQINMVLNSTDPLDETLAWLGDPLLKHVNILSTTIENSMLENKFGQNEEFDKKCSYHLALAVLRELGIVPDLDREEIFYSTYMDRIVDYSSFHNDTVSLGNEAMPGGPCTPGMQKVFVSVDGTFYPCEKMNEMSKCMQIGSIETGFDLKRIANQVNIAQLTPEECCNCWAQTHCTICQRYADGGNRLSGKVKLAQCSESRKKYLDSIRMCTLLDEYKTIYKQPGRQLYDQE